MHYQKLWRHLNAHHFYRIFSLTLLKLAFLFTTVVPLLFLSIFCFSIFSVFSFCLHFINLLHVFEIGHMCITSRQVFQTDTHMLTIIHEKVWTSIFWYLWCVFGMLCVFKQFEFLQFVKILNLNLFRVHFHYLIFIFQFLSVT